MAGSWNSGGSGGNVAVRVVDAINGDLVSEAAASGTTWWSAKRTVRGVVTKLYVQLGYTGTVTIRFMDGDGHLEEQHVLECEPLSKGGVKLKIYPAAAAAAAAAGLTSQASSC